MVLATQSRFESAVLILKDLFFLDYIRHLIIIILRLFDIGSLYFFNLGVLFLNLVFKRLIGCHKLFNLQF